MSSFRGRITTSGKSEAIRLEKALFRAHPEFRQRAAVRASIIAPGQMLVSVVEDDGVGAVSIDDDPVVGAFLSFLERDISTHPERVQPLSASCIAEAVQLTASVTVDDDETIDDDVSL